MDDVHKSLTPLAALREVAEDDGLVLGRRHALALIGVVEAAERLRECDEELDAEGFPDRLDELYVALAQPWE